MKLLLSILVAVGVLIIPAAASAQDFSGGVCTGAVKVSAAYKASYCAVYGPQGSYTTWYNKTYGKGGLYCQWYGYNC